MAPSRDSEWPTARSIIRSLSNRQYLPRRTYSVNLGRSRTLAPSRLAKSLRRLHRRSSSTNDPSSPSKSKISKPKPWLPPLAFTRSRRDSFTGPWNLPRSESTSSNWHARSNSEPQIYFTPLEALTANKLDDLEPWLGVLVAQPRSGEVDFGLPGPRRRSKGRLSRTSGCADGSRRSALTMASVYSRKSGDEDTFFFASTQGHDSMEVTLGHSPLPLDEPNHHASVPVDVDLTFTTTSEVLAHVPRKPVPCEESEDEMEEDEDPFVFERFYRPTPNSSPSKSDASTRSASSVDTPPPCTPQSSFNQSFLTPSTPSSPTRYRPPSPFPFKTSLPQLPSSDSSQEDLSSSSTASHGHRALPINCIENNDSFVGSRSLTKSTLLKESYNTLPGVPAFSISSSPQSSLRSCPSRTFVQCTESPPGRPVRKRPVVPSGHRRGNTHDGHGTIRPRERLKSLRRIASASQAPTSMLKASPLLTRKLSYKAAGAGDSSTSLPTNLSSASASTVSVPATAHDNNSGRGLQLQMNSKNVGFPGTESVESLAGTVGHSVSEAHSVRSGRSEHSVGVEGKKIVQIRWGYI